MRWFDPARGLPTDHARFAPIDSVAGLPTRARIEAYGAAAGGARAPPPPRAPLDALARLIEEELRLSERFMAPD